MAHKPMLDVILRTHSLGNYRQGAERVTDTLGGKTELIIRTLRSIVRSLLVLERANSVNIRLTILDDHSDATCLARIKEELAVCPFETVFIPLVGHGNGASMQAVFEYARDHAKDFIYFVEDDYLHEDSALIEMFESFQVFCRNLNRTNIGLFPVDQRDYYLPGAINLTRVVPGSRRHWRVNDNTTSTFFIPKSLFQEHWDLFVKNPESDGTGTTGMTEVDSINTVWRDHATLFTPIPTLAYHVHRPEEMPPFSNWRTLWEKLNEYIA